VFKVAEYVHLNLTCYLFFTLNALKHQGSVVFHLEIIERLASQLNQLVRSALDFGLGVLLD